MEIGEGENWEHSLINNFCMSHRKASTIVKMNYLKEGELFIIFPSTWPVGGSQVLK